MQSGKTLSMNRRSARRAACEFAERPARTGPGAETAPSSQPRRLRYYLGKFMVPMHVRILEVETSHKVGRDGALRRPRRVQRRNDSARCFAGGDIAARCPCYENCQAVV